MSGTAELDDLYSAIEESAGLLGVACSREKVWPMLTAYDAAQQDIIAFRVATDERHGGDFNYRFSLPRGVEPYDVAVSKGLTPKTDHPVGTLLSQLQEHCPIDSSGVDFGVLSGFKKVWVYFPKDNFPRMSRIAEVPSMPGSVAENISLFERHGLGDQVDVMGIDYNDRSVNLYFPGAPAPDTLLAMHRDIGLPDPSEQMLRFFEQAFGIYTTLSWDSEKIVRISFGAKITDLSALPVRLGPKIEKLVNGLPYGAEHPKLVYAAATSGGEEYYKLQSYYRWQPRGTRAGSGYPPNRAAS